MSLKKWVSKHWEDCILVFLIFFFLIEGTYFFKPYSGLQAFQHELGSCIGKYSAYVKTDDPDIFKGSFCYFMTVIFALILAKKQDWKKKKE